MNFEFFEIPEIIEGAKSLEVVTQLEPGVVLERIGNAEPVNETVSENIIGNVESDSQNWHLQTEGNSCAICCQEFIAEQLLGGDFSEQKMSDFAEKKGWYCADAGTTPEDTGKILESLGLEVEREYNQNMNDIAMAISDGSKVICGVNGLAMYIPEIADIPGITADHVVQVIGIDMSVPGREEVILNDSGIPNGKGIHVNAINFLKAWSLSDNYMATASKGD